MALRKWTRRNKNELIVLTGALYAFVSYLTAFTLEVLFLLDLARQNSESANQDAISQQQQQNMSDPAQRLYPSLFKSRSTLAEQSQQQQTLIDRFNFDSIQAHLAVSCLAIAVLYFLLFIASLKLVVALILRSTFVILIWICLMTTMYLPEFGLVIYVSIYCWGLETRNGQTELIFYLFRALLNVLFIWSARKLFKEWSFEKTFLRLKSSTNGYDSPYFISGADCRAANLASFNRGSATGAPGGSLGFLGSCRNDSLSTTINPLFTSSTLNLSSYDQIALGNQSSADCSPLGNYRYCGYNYNYRNSNDRSLATGEWSLGANNLWRLSAKGDQATAGSASQRHQHLSPKSYRNDGFVSHYSEVQQQRRQRASRLPRDGEPGGRLPANDIDDNVDIDDDDNLTSCELDIEYRTLSHCRRSFNDKADANTDAEEMTTNNSRQTPQQQSQSNAPHQSDDSYRNHRRRMQIDSGHSNNNNHDDDDIRVDDDEDVAYYCGGTITSSTQSLDRLRYLRSPIGNPYPYHNQPPHPDQQHQPNVSSAIHNPEQVILRPLRHRPFDYLHRPGSSSNINKINNP